MAIIEVRGNLHAPAVQAECLTCPVVNGKPRILAHWSYPNAEERQDIHVVADDHQRETRNHEVRVVIFHI